MKKQRAAWSERARTSADGALAWARQRVPWFDLAEQAVERERLAAASLLAGGLAYRLFFWLVPLGLVLAAGLSFWVEADPDGLEDAAQDFGVGGAATRSALEAIQHDAHSRWYFLIVGVALLIWFGGGVARAANVAHAIAWRLPPEKLARPLLAGAVYSGVMIALLGCGIGVAALRERTPGPGIALLLALGGVYVAVTVFFTSYLPRRAPGWRPLVPGAVLTAVGTLGIHALVSLYLAPKLGRSTELYGSLGAATVILLWLYLEARLVVAGAFLNAALWERREPQTEHSK